MLNFLSKMRLKNKQNISLKIQLGSIFGKNFLQNIKYKVLLQSFIQANKNRCGNT